MTWILLLVILNTETGLDETYVMDYGLTLADCIERTADGDSLTCEPE